MKEVQKKGGKPKCAKGRDCVSLGTIFPRDEYERFKLAAAKDKRSLSKAILVGVAMYCDKMLETAATA